MIDCVWLCCFEFAEFASAMRICAFPQERIKLGSILTATQGWHRWIRFQSSQRWTFWRFEDVWSLFEVKIGEIGMSTVSDCGCGWFHATLSTPLVWGAVSWRIVQKRTVIKTHRSLENRGCEAKLQAFPDRWNKEGWNATFLRPSTVLDYTVEKVSKRFTRFTPLVLLVSHHLHHVFHTTCFTAVFLWIAVIFSLHPKSMKMTRMKKHNVLNHALKGYWQFRRSHICIDGLGAGSLQTTTNNNKQQKTTTQPTNQQQLPELLVMRRATADRHHSKPPAE